MVFVFPITVLRLLQAGLAAMDLMDARLPQLLQQFVNRNQYCWLKARLPDTQSAVGSSWVWHQRISSRMVLLSSRRVTLTAVASFASICCNSL